MFGYMESNYTVVEQVQFAVRENQQFVERRSSGRKLDYIAIYEKDAAGKVVFDLLFFYDNEEHLEDDWLRVSQDVSTKTAELRYCQKVLDHHIGYLRGGGIVMY